MNNNLKISVDFDGCLGKTMDFVCDLINLQTCRNFTYKEINRWTYWEDIGFSKEFWKAYDFLDKYGRIPIKPYDNQVFTSLREIGEFDIVTANSEVAKLHIEDWMNWHGELNEYNDLYFDINCIGRKTAAEKLELDYNLYIDDNPNLAKSAVNYPNKRILLANAPWNKHIEDSFNVRRFESWKEIPKLIESIQSYDGN